MCVVFFFTMNCPTFTAGRIVYSLSRKFTNLISTALVLCILVRRLVGVCMGTRLG